MCDARESQHANLNLWRRLGANAARYAFALSERPCIPHADQVFPHAWRQQIVAKELADAWIAGYSEERRRLTNGEC